MKKPFTLAVLGIAAVLMMGADDSCGVEDDATPVKQANGTNAKQSQKAPEPTKPEMTAGQENAVNAASDYLGYSAFSKSGLIDQLVYEGYPKKDAKFAVSQLDVNWKQQAYQTAKDYLGYSSFSLSGLIDQLAYDGYTPEQAEYGATKAYNE